MATERESDAVSEIETVPVSVIVLAEVIEGVPVFETVTVFEGLNEVEVDKEDVALSETVLLPACVAEVESDSVIEFERDSVLESVFVVVTDAVIETANVCDFVPLRLDEIEDEAG